MTIQPGAICRANGRAVVLLALRGQRGAIVPLKASTGRPTKEHRADIELQDGQTARCGKAYTAPLSTLLPTGFSIHAAEIEKITRAVAREQTRRDQERQGARDAAHLAWAHANKPGNDHRAAHD